MAFTKMIPTQLGRYQMSRLRFVFQWSPCCSLLSITRNSKNFASLWSLMILCDGRTKRSSWLSKYYNATPLVHYIFIRITMELDIQDNIYVETSQLSIFYWLIRMRWMYGINTNYISGQSNDVNWWNPIVNITSTFRLLTAFRCPA